MVNICNAIHSVIFAMACLLLFIASGSATAQTIVNGTLSLSSGEIRSDNLQFVTDSLTAGLVLPGDNQLNGNLIYATPNSGIQYSGTNTVNGSVSGLGAGTHTIALNSAASSILSFNGNMTDGQGTVGLQMNGPGTTVLSGSNTFSGDIALNGGVLKLNSLAAISTAGGTISFNGGTLYYTTNNYSSSAGQNPDYTKRFSTAPGQQYSIRTEFPTNVNIKTNLNSAGGSITFSGNGDIRLSGTNSFSGGINFNGGLVILQGAEGLGSTGTISFGGGILSTGFTTDFSSRFSQAPNQAYAVAVGDGTIYATSLTSVGGSFLKHGFGNLILKGNETYTGATMIDEGPLTLAPGASLPIATTVIMSSPVYPSGAIFQLGNASGSVDCTIAGLTVNGTNSKTGVVGNNASATSGLIINNPADCTYTGVLGGIGPSVVPTVAQKNMSLTKSGVGTFTLSGTFANVYTGTTTVSQGELDLNKSSGNALSAGGAGDLAKPDIIVNGGIIKWLKPEQVDDTATLLLTSGTLNLNGQFETISGLQNSGADFVVPNGTTLSVNGAGVVWSGGTSTINTGGRLVTNHLVLTGGTNFIQGGSIINSLQVVSNPDSSKGSMEMTGANLTLGSDNTFQGNLSLSQQNLTCHASSVTSAFSNSGSGTKLGSVGLLGTLVTVEKGTTPNGIDLSFSAAALGSLIKAGPGTLQLSGTNAGGVTVNEGVFQMDGSTTGTATLNGGTSRGTGTYGNVTVKSGATLVTGDGPNVLNSTLKTGSLSLGAGSNVAIKLNTSLVQCDLINVTAMFSLTGANLNLSELAANSVHLSLGTKFHILSYAQATNFGSGSNVFYFNGNALPQSSKFVFGANIYQINYSDNSSVTLTTVAPAVSPLTYDQWAANYSVTGGASGMPFDDGVSNLLKYFFDINPTHFIGAQDEAALPTSGLDTLTTPGTTYLTLTYRQAAYSTGLQTEVQTSIDLQTWQTVTPDFTDTLSIDPANFDSTIRVKVNTSGVPRKFIRLRVSQP